MKHRRKQPYRRLLFLLCTVLPFMPGPARALAQPLTTQPAVDFASVITPFVVDTAPTPVLPVVATVAALPAWADGNSGPFAIPPGGALPADQTCSKLVTAAREVSPENTAANSFTGDAQAASRGSSVGPYESRITGAYKGTTDEIIQWAACKWGFEPNTVRAQVLVESNLHQTSMGGFLPESLGCVDPALRRPSTTTPDTAVPSTTTSTTAVRATTTTQPLIALEQRLPIGTTTTTLAPTTSTTAPAGVYECPTAFGLMQIRSDYHPGTYPLSAKSTAFNLDYSLAMKRACYDGISFLGPQTRGDAWGCVGAHYAGAWRTPPALDYIDKVKARL